jgi:hypothetical protein
MQIISPLEEWHNIRVEEFTVGDRISLATRVHLEILLQATSGIMRCLPLFDHDDSMRRTTERRAQTTIGKRIMLFLYDITSSVSKRDKQWRMEGKLRCPNGCYVIMANTSLFLFRSTGTLME